MKESRISSDQADENFFPVFAAMHATQDFRKRTLDENYNRAHDSVVWLMIFQAVYGEPPVHDDTLPEYYACGVTDPRWNSLLHTQEAYSSYVKFCDQYIKNI
ncbi:hypothetical protein K2P47_03230 [Patescibacteria group bacterium]|nr:hypothetical protein [Patescibacteria group bacterium]